jgi:hypothetical protein
MAAIETENCLRLGTFGRKCHSKECHKSTADPRDPFLAWLDLLFRRTLLLGMCKLIGHFAVFTMFAYATWSVVIFTLLLLNNTTSHAGKVSDEPPAAQAEVTSDEPAQTPTPDPTPTAEGRFDRMYKLFHLGS